VAQKELSTFQILIFAATTWPLATAGTALSYVPPFYSEYIGISLGAVGLITTICRIYDVVADLGIAYISDNTSGRFGRRKPWVVLGLALYIPAALLLYMPGSHATVYSFAFALFLFFSAWTIAFIPFLTQATELTTSYNLRNKTNVAQSFVTQLALLSAIAMPFLFIDPRTVGFRLHLSNLLDRISFGLLDGLVAFLRLPPAHGGEIFHRNLQIVACLLLGLTPILLGLYMLLIRGRAAGTASVATKGSITAAIRNRMFLRFAIGYFFIMCGTGGYVALFPFVVIHALRLPDSYLILFLSLNLIALFTTPFWSVLLRRFERSTCVIIGAAGMMAGFLMLTVIPSGNETLAFLSVLVIGIPGQAVHLIPLLVAGDCADFAKWKTGTESRAIHTSLLTCMIKVGAVTGALLIGLVSLLGFDPAKGETSGQAVLALKVCGLLIPALLLGAGIYFMLNFPLTRRRHAAIQSRLLRRAQAAASMSG
jgi:Na+/melibiose symporter-like transporter